MISASYGNLSVAIGTAVAKARAGDMTDRLRNRDHTLWRDDPTGITDRLGWLKAPTAMRKEVGRLERFGEAVRDRFADVLVLGMGGSSLAPAALAEVFDSGGGPRLRVVDTTDPDFLASVADSTDPRTTLHIVATKSGTTVETLSAFRFFLARVEAAPNGAESGAGEAGAAFAAITDPGSPLAAIARDAGFREIFLNPPDVGGRYSALTYFGLVPAAILGVDVDGLLERGEALIERTLSGRDGRALGLGIALGALAGRGRDKLTLSASPGVAPLADWIEQLVAESTGKEGKGIVPVVGEPLGAPEVYGDDRVFVDIALADDADRVDALAALEAAGHPVIQLWMRDRLDLGAQFALWELATAFAGAEMGIQPFDQPDVEAAKRAARSAVEEFRATGRVPRSPSTPADPEALARFLGDADPRGYVSLQAYLTPDADTDAGLAALRVAIRDRTRLATTVGYGPRFLHSTGQLHKGDAGRGRFVQLTAEPDVDVPVPEMSGSAAGGDGGADIERRAPPTLTFGTLLAAQAVGDREALEEKGRAVIRMDVGPRAGETLQALAAGLRGALGGDSDG